MTEVQKKFVSLEKQKEEIKKFFEELSDTMAELQKEIGLNGMFQDNEGTVYKIVEPDGKYVQFDKVSYLRTRRLHEERSPLPLAIKEAEAAGFNVPKK
jgi:hypothetical protein